MKMDIDMKARLLFTLGKELARRMGVPDMDFTAPHLKVELGYLIPGGFFHLNNG